MESIALLAQTGALNEVSNAVDRLSAQGFWGLIILLTLIGSLVVWNVYADKRRYDKANEREHERWDKQMENWKSVYDGQVGKFDGLAAKIEANTEASNRVSDTFVRYAEHQMASAQETARNSKQTVITFAEVRASVTELNKSLNTVIAPNITRLSEDNRKLSEDTRKQLEVIATQTEQNSSTLTLVKALAAEQSRIEKAAVSRAEQIHVDFERMRKDRQEHLDEMTRTIGVINTKLDAMLESQQRLTDAVTVLIKRQTDEVAKVEVPPEGSAAA